MINLLTIDLLSNMTEAVCYMLVHSLWQIPVIALVIKILTRRKISTSTKSSYIANLSILGLSLTAGACTLSYYIMLGTPVSTATDIALNINHTAASSDAAQFFNKISLTQLDAHWISSYGPYITVAWALGVLIFSGRIILGCIGVSYLRRDISYDLPVAITETFSTIKTALRLPDRTRLGLSSRISVPMIIGHIKPIILLPMASINQLDQQEVEAILVHEATHILQHDYIKNIVIMLTESLFFYHPVVWMLTREIREEREHICDDMVLRLYPDRMRYAQTLVKLEEYWQGHNPTLSLALFNKNFKLMNRIQRILNLHTTTHSLRSRIGMIAILLSGMILLSSAAIHHVSQPASDLLRSESSAHDHIMEVVDHNTDLLSMHIEDISGHSTTSLDTEVGQETSRYEVPINETLIGDASQKRRWATMKEAMNRSFDYNMVRLREEIDELTNHTNSFSEVSSPPLIMTLPIDTLPAEELERLRAEMREMKESMREKNRNLQGKVREEEKRLRAQYEADVKAERERIKEIKERLKEEGYSTIEGNAARFNYLEGLARWGEDVGNQIASSFDEGWQEEMEAWSEKMEAWGEQLADRYDNYSLPDEEEWAAIEEHLSQSMSNIFDEDWLAELEHIELDESEMKELEEALEEMQENLGEMRISFDRDFNNMPPPPVPPAPPAPPTPPSFDLDEDELLGNLESDGFLTKAKNKIVLKNYEMFVNGKKQPQEVFDKYMFMLSDIHEGAFEEGADIEILFRTKQINGRHTIQSMSISSDH